MKTMHLTIFGIVQGVYLRVNAKRKADELGLYGYIKNLPNGTVEAVVQGNQEVLKKFLDWCYNDGGSAKVDHIKISWLEETGKFSDFKIIR